MFFMMHIQAGRQAIHIAAATGNIMILKLLVDTYKVPVNVTDKVGAHIYVAMYTIHCNHV